MCSNEEAGGSEDSCFGKNGPAISQVILIGWHLREAVISKGVHVFVKHVNEESLDGDVVLVPVH